ncbi:hypothetical protein [Janthinobacterium sp. PSPC2-1]|uniref:hypothetical protein n=1 Tax=unclassified Janthinobacterium TaxID=2610881 RepID=UPI003CE8DAF1
MKKPNTPSISHAIFVEDLIQKCAAEVKIATKHAEEIDIFGQAMLPFQQDLLLCVSVHKETVILMASIKGDHVPVMLKLIQAGFEIGETEEEFSPFPERKLWKALVRSQDVDFFLYFETTDDALEVA